MVAKLLHAGVDVVRLNLSHGDQEGHARAIETVRQVGKRQGRHVPVIADLMGPRYRLGKIVDGPRALKRDERVSLGAGKGSFDLPVDDRALIAHLKRGERVLIDNGLVELEVEAKRGDRVAARVITPGLVSTRKGINLPDTELPFTISRKDRSDIAFVVAAGVDYIAASYVAQAADLRAIRKVASAHGDCPPLVAKIERKAAVERLGEIVLEADAVMVARGDLGVEVPLDQVPVLQKRIVAAARLTGTPVIVATQMLESMIDHPRPTRAEATDVANAVLEGADALMLSGETAAGRHPVEAVKTMARIIERAESYRLEFPETVRLTDHHDLVATETKTDPRGELARVICEAGARAADELGVALVVAFSQGGFTARSIARYRPTAPIRVFTTDETVARQVQLVWGVRPVLMSSEVDHLYQVVGVVDRHLRSAHLVQPGDSMVLLMGYPIPERPLTNLMRIHRFDA